MKTPCAACHSDVGATGHSKQAALQDSLPFESTTGPRSGKFIIAAVIGLAVGVFFWFDLDAYLTLETVKANRDRLLTFADEHRAAAAASFIAVYSLVTGLSLPGATILTLVGGFLFGSVTGTFFVNLGATSGATLAFLTARYLLRGWVEQKFGEKLRPIQEGFAKNAFSYLVTLRLVPLFPFFLVNLVSGLTRVRLGSYVAATALGIIPGSFVYAYAGRQLGTINSLKEIASPNVILAFTLLGLLALVPIAYKRYTGKPAQPGLRTEVPFHP
ncbi:MAG: TVP38/TMEM64 family protein [Nitrospiraceae bacterium]|nr:TVP38/TMEM64 family protein [Nitrospiraceae bacterium]MCS6284440.1 TVP38/TMEM64 family protein [Nitrospira sp.]